MNNEFKIQDVEGDEQNFVSSYVPNNYLFHFKKNIKLKLSVDFIILSLFKDFKQLQRILTNISRYSFSSKFYKTKTSTVKTFSVNFNGKSYTIKYIYFYKGPSVWLRIDDPDTDLLQYISKMVFPLYYHLVQVEFTFDFYGPNINSIYNQLRSTYFLSYASKSKQFKFSYKDTEYSNDMRKTQSKGLRLYKKRDNKGNITFARLELLYKRNKLRKMKINSIEDVLDVECNTILQPLHFKEFNYDRFIKNFIRRMEKGNPECNCDVMEVIVKIEQLIKEYNVSTADKYAKNFISYTCFDIHPFEVILNMQLDDKTFLNGETVEIPYGFLFDTSFESLSGIHPKLLVD